MEENVQMMNVDVKTCEKGFIQLYRNVLMLYNYALLNNASFIQLINKYEKATKKKIESIRVSLNESEFATGGEVKKLVEEIEKLYSRAFLNGNVKKAKDILNERRHDRRDGYMLVLGFFAGAFIPFMILWLIGACCTLFSFLLLFYYLVRSRSATFLFYQFRPILNHSLTLLLLLPYCPFIKSK